MAILQGDIKFVASQVMDDVPEGGGGPTAIEIPDGASNAVFADISEVDRAGGSVSIRKLFLTVQTDDTDTFLDSNIIVAEPPLDPMVSVTLFSTNDVFDRRSESQQRLESYLIPGPKISGFLLENHIRNQRAIQLFVRPGTPPPTIGRTLVLVQDEGLPAEKLQYVRVIRVTSETRTFTESVGSSFVDYQANVLVCDLSDALRYDFAGSPPSRLFTPAAGKTIIRDTIAADAGSYYGAVALRTAAAINDQTLQVDSVYTQLVPSARTETSTLDQRPAGQRSVTLATTPRLIELGVTPHTLRVKIGQENRGFNYVQILRPFPAPGTVVVSFRALGQWYTLQDNGSGTLEGGGTGTVNYSNGSISITLPSLPDANSAVIFAWGETSAFANRAGTAQFRPPEFALKLDHDGIKPGTLSISWTSGAVAKTAADNGTGALTGDAVGEINYASGALFIRPAAMIDAGGQFAIDYQHTTMVTKTVAGPTPDAGGFVSVPLDDVPASGSISVNWKTARSVSNSSGATAANNSTKTSDTTTTSVYYPPGLTVRAPVSLTRVPINIAAGAAPGSGMVPGMFPGGTRAATGEVVQVAVEPSTDEEGAFYDAPDSSAISWTELEFAAFAKSVDGKTYYRWGHRPSGLSGG